MRFKKMFVFGLMFMLSFVAGCSFFVAGNSSVDVSLIKGDFLVNSSYVQWIGRTEFSQQDKYVYTYYAATGFTVDFEGTEVEVVYSADNTTSDANRPYFIASVDSQVASDGESFCLTSSLQTVKVAQGLAYGKHSVTVLKRSEPENSLTAVCSIKTDGKFLAPTVKNSLKFQIIGSSGITGHGCFGTSSSQPWTTENSSALSGFGCLAARKFGAECQVVSASGLGMCWSASRLGGATMAEAYNAVGLVASYNVDGSTKKLTAQGAWDHSKWVPNVIIANIGGNDWNMQIKKNEAGTAQRTADENTFKEAVKSLLTVIHNLYPNVKVIWAVNSTSSGNGKLACDAIDTLSFKNQIYPMSLPNWTDVDHSKAGADDHPDMVAQEAYATAIANKITSVTGWQQI